MQVVIRHHFLILLKLREAAQKYGNDHDLWGIYRSTANTLVKEEEAIKTLLKITKTAE